MGFGPAGTWPTPSGPGGGFALPAYGTSMNMFTDAGALASDYTQKYGEAKQANLDRYAEGKQGYGDLYNRNMGRLDQLSGQNAADIRQNAESDRGNINQRMSSLGLGGTTIGDTLKSGVTREENASLNRNNDNQIGAKNAADANLSEAKLGFIERRSDPYPDMGAYGAMMSSMGRAAAGGMGGGMGGAGGGGGGGGYGGSNVYGSGAPMAGMFVANTNGAQGAGTGGGQTIYGNPDEIARAERLRAAGSITGDSFDTTPQRQDFSGYGTQYGSTNTNSGSRFGAGYLPAGGMQPQMLQRQFQGF